MLKGVQDSELKQSSPSATPLPQLEYLRKRMMGTVHNSLHEGVALAVPTYFTSMGDLCACAERQEGFVNSTMHGLQQHRTTRRARNSVVLRPSHVPQFISQTQVMNRLLRTAMCLICDSSRHVAVRVAPITGHKW